MRVTTKIPLAHPVLDGNEKKYVMECMETSWISSIGRFIPLFEQRFAEFCDVPHAVACNTGTAALHLALAGLALDQGDEVIIPTLTFVATANAIRYCGATPVLVDSEPRTMNIDPCQIEERITPRTKGIIAVHLYGHPADMNPILDIARRRNLFVVEDAAEAHGALYRGAKVGGIGDAGAFSFFGNKVITTGEGGMVTTRDPSLAAKIRHLRGQGMDSNRRYWFDVVGYNYRMTNIEAAIGLAQVEQIDRRLEARRRVAMWYQKHLAGLCDDVILPIEEDWAHHVFWLYTIVLTKSSNVERDDVIAKLDEAGVETRPVFYPMHLLPPYRERHGSYPVAEAVARRGVSLPSHGLMTEEDVRHIADRIKSVCDSAARRLPLIT